MGYISISLLIFVLFKLISLKGLLFFEDFPLFSEYTEIYSGGMMKKNNDSESSLHGSALLQKKRLTGRESNGKFI